MKDSPHRSEADEQHKEAVSRFMEFIDGDGDPSGIGEQQERILSSEDLNLEDIEKLGENRHVVPVNQEQEEDVADGKESETAEVAEVPEITNGTEMAYCAAVTVKTPAAEASFRIASNDVTEFFDGFLRWYLNQIAPDEEAQDALRTLVESSSF
mgnify:CR=1 FL=1